MAGKKPSSGKGKMHTSKSGPKVGSGERFQALKNKLAAKGAHDPAALAAYIGRKKYSKSGFQAMAAAGRTKRGGRKK